MLSEYIERRKRKLASVHGQWYTHDGYSELLTKRSIFLSELQAIRDSNKRRQMLADADMTYVAEALDNLEKAIALDVDNVLDISIYEMVEQLRVMVDKC